MPSTRPPAAARPRSYRLLVHDPDETRAAAIADRARRGGHLVAVEPGPEGLRRAVLDGTWDAVALEILGGTVASPFLLLELRHALRRRGRSLPPAVVYVRAVLAGHDAAISRLADELGPDVECVRTEDADRVVRALERAASGRIPAAIPIVPDGLAPSRVGGAALADAAAPTTTSADRPGSGSAPGAGRADEAPAYDAPAATPASPEPPAAPASNWRR